MSEPVFFRTPAEIEAWLAKNHATARELLVGMYRKGASEQGVTYEQALDAALCWGWIDGVRRKVDENRFVQRFSPRLPNSPWSLVNIRKVESLIAQGRMQPPGLEAFARHEQNRSRYEEIPVELDEPLLAQMREVPAAWDFYQAQPPSYHKAVARWILSAKRDETRQKRLAELIEVSAQGQRKAFM